MSKFWKAYVVLMLFLGATMYVGFLIGMIYADNGRWYESVLLAAVFLTMISLDLVWERYKAGKENKKNEGGNNE